MRGPELRPIAASTLTVLLLIHPQARTEETPAAGAPYRYASLPFLFSPPRRDLQWLTEAFALTIADRLESLGFDVASRRDRVEIAETAGASSPSPMTLASRIKLARGLRAARAITGTISFEPGEGAGAHAGQITVQAMILDVERGRIVHRRTITGTLNELFSMIDEVALETAWQDPSPPGPEARKVLKEISDPPLPSFEVVMKAIAEKDPERQQAAIDAAAEAARDHPMLTRRLADALIETGRIDEGLARLQSLDPVRQPDPWRLHLDRAELLFARGDVDAAATAAARSLTARDTAPAHILLARIALTRGDRAEADKEARLAAAVDPDHPGLPRLLQEIAGSPSAEEPSRP